MKNTPILFSALMVKQIEAGNKSMTRRAVKGMALDWLSGFTPEYIASPDNHFCPYGEIGDILWIREEHYRYGHWVKDGNTKKGAQKWKFVSVSDDVLYHNNPPSSFRVSRYKDAPEENFWYKRLARFMPKSLCRYELEITDKKIERVQDISEEDAKNEGVPDKCWKDEHGVFHVCEKKSEDMVGPFGSYVLGFNALWNHINGVESWDLNIWVWCVSFKLKQA